MLVYTSTRLTFKRDEIEALGEDDYFKIHVTNDNTSFKMKKKEFHDTFSNVINTKSYREFGNYNYKKTPDKALKYIIQWILTKNSLKMKLQNS